jgi:hypothetical protein
MICYTIMNRLDFLPRIMQKFSVIMWDKVSKNGFKSFLPTDWRVTS